MQRVLSFPTARGFGDSGEFVTKRMCFSFMFSIGFLALLSGFLLGRFALDQELALSRQNLRQVKLRHQEMFERASGSELFNISDVLGGIKGTSIIQTISVLRESASPIENAALQQAHVIRSHLEEFGFDLISPLKPVQISLSYPDSQKKNQVVVVDGGRGEIFKCNDTRPTIVLSQGMQSLVTETTDELEGIPVYVNFGRNEDYLYLSGIGVEVVGRVVLARAGGISASDLVDIAIEHDAVGVLIYLDPQQSDLDPALLTAADLGSLQKSYDRAKSVPVLILAASDAERILKDMSGDEPSPDSWRGGLQSSYPIGPGFSSTDWKLRMQVNTVNIVKAFYNVIGAIRGSQEPDTVVILANNRDVWITNNLELAGTAVTLEVARVLGDMKTKKNWKPNRSVMVAFWGLTYDESDMLPPSTALWSELHERTAAYLNIEFRPFAGSQVNARITPILADAYEKASQFAHIEAPTDIMLQFGRKYDLAQSGMPFLEFQSNRTTRLDMELKEETLSDLTVFWSHLSWSLVDKQRLPFNLQPYITFFNNSMNVLNQRFETIARRHALFLDKMNDSVWNLIRTIDSFQSQWIETDTMHPADVARVNNMLVRFVHALSCQRDDDVTNQLYITRHIIFSRSTTGSNRGAGFGVLQDLLREITSTHAPEDLLLRIVHLLTDTIKCLDHSSNILNGRLETFVLGNS